MVIAEFALLYAPGLPPCVGVIAVILALVGAVLGAPKGTPISDPLYYWPRPKPLDRRTFRDCPESDGEQRADNIHIKWDPRVARREITRDHHLLDVSRGVAEQEDRGGADGRRLEFQIAPEGHTGGCADRQVGHADLELEWARFPSDESRSDGRKENVKDTRPQSRDANREQHYPR